MSKRLKVEFLRDGRIRLLQSFGEVPRGFETDGASVPRFFWRIFGHPFSARHVRGGVRHDWRYKCGIMPRKTADAAYRRDLIADGMPRVLAWLEYFAVRLCGRSRYNNQKNKEKKR